MERLTKFFLNKNMCNASGDICKQQKSSPYDETCCCYCEIYQKMIDKLSDYEDAEEQGLMLRLPCKIGDELWWFDAFGDLRTSKVNSMFVEFGIDGIVIETLICNIYAKDIGKAVFLTKEEAEQALSEMKGGQNG